MQDNCAAIELVLRQGTPGEVYNIGSETYLTNSELTAVLLRACGADWDSVRYVSDRPANDLRYAMDYAKVTELGYRPHRSFEDGIAQTVDWYRHNPDRWAPVQRNPRAPIAQIALDAPQKEEGA